VRRVLVFQHSDESPLGIMAPVLAEAGVEALVIDGENGCRLPADAEDACGLILLGGVMSANDDATCPPPSLSSASASGASSSPAR